MAGQPKRALVKIKFIKEFYFIFCSETTKEIKNVLNLG